MKPLLSIVIPCYNEKSTIIRLIKKINQQKINKEVIIVDDGSDDGTKELLKKINRRKYNINKIFFKKKNSGKGSSIRVAQKYINGKYVIIQDADLEYEPAEYDKLLKPFITTDADIVYGSRFIGGDLVRLHFFWHFVANKILTLFSNIVTNLNMTDMETGYKLFKSDVIKSIKLKENSFGIEPEITIKLAKKKFIFYEVPISYRGRSYEEGKKITIKDAFAAIFCIIKYRFFD